MANNFTLTLDTTGPANPSISIEGGAAYAYAQLVNLTVGTTDGDTTGYQMKIWGDVDGTHDANVQPLEGNSAWFTYATNPQVKLSAGDGAKTLNIKIRDDVLNESNQATDSITLDTTAPVVNITSGPDRTKISDKATVNVCSFDFQVDQDFKAYKVKVVSATDAAHDTGVQIGETQSVNMQGTGSWTTASTISCQVHQADLEAASAGDGDKIIKIFAQDNSDQWSL